MREQVSYDALWAEQSASKTSLNKIRTSRPCVFSLRAQYPIQMGPRRLPLLCFLT